MLISQNFTPLSALLGGVIIGLAASLTWVMLGRIAGISGILARANLRRLGSWLRPSFQVLLRPTSRPVMQSLFWPGFWSALGRGLATDVRAGMGCAASAGVLPARL